LGQLCGGAPRTSPVSRGFPFYFFRIPFGFAGPVGLRLDGGKFAIFYSAVYAGRSPLVHTKLKKKARPCPFRRYNDYGFSKRTTRERATGRNEGTERKPCTTSPSIIDQPNNTPRIGVKRPSSRIRVYNCSLFADRECRERGDSCGRGRRGQMGRLRRRCARLP